MLIYFNARDVNDNLDKNGNSNLVINCKTFTENGRIFICTYGLGNASSALDFLFRIIFLAISESV